MAKARKKARKAAKRPAKKRKAVSRAKARRPAGKKLRRARARKSTSIVDTVTETIHDSAELRRRLAGPNTFED